MAINGLNSVQNYFFYKIEETDNDVSKKNRVDWDQFCNNNNENFNRSIIYITEKPFSDNFFSHENAEYAVISSSDWESVFAPPALYIYLMYIIAQVTINFELDLNENMEMSMVHKGTRGCIFDMCNTKSEIKMGMATGAVCSECSQKLMIYGIEKKALMAIENILSYVRLATLGKTIRIGENDAFVVMRFSDADENANAYKYGIQMALKELGINCVRADDKMNSGQLLLKIRESIERSRFIIVKIDSENLNVYFELGLAMGLNKDILFVTEEQFLDKVPTDLKNWECITYPHGNYEILKAKIIKYYVENYHRKLQNTEGQVSGTRL